MPSLGTSAIAPVALNPMVDLASIDHSIQQTQVNAVALQGAQQAEAIAALTLNWGLAEGRLLSWSSLVSSYVEELFG